MAGMGGGEFFAGFVVAKTGGLATIGIYLTGRVTLTFCRLDATTVHGIFMGGVGIITRCR